MVVKQVFTVALNDSLDGKLLVLKGDPATHLAALAAASGAKISALEPVL